jgi:hypothetical protein
MYGKQRAFALRTLNIYFESPYGPSKAEHRLHNAYLINQGK